MVSPRDVTALLGDWSRGDRTALNELLPLVYAELRRVALRQLRKERADHTLQPTALVHEVFIRLVDQRRVDWQNRAHFFGVAANVMRRILVDHARRHGARKRGEGVRCVSIDEAQDVAAANEMPILALDHVLERLERSTLNWPRSSSFVRLAGSRSRKRPMCSACPHRQPSATGAPRKRGSIASSAPRFDRDR
jgi:RNA polymerase sigma factor (TIGR02999 family)